MVAEPIGRTRHNSNSPRSLRNSSFKMFRTEMHMWLDEGRVVPTKYISSIKSCLSCIKFSLPVKMKKEIFERISLCNNNNNCPGRVTAKRSLSCDYPYASGDILTKNTKFPKLKNNIFLIRDKLCQESLANQRNGKLNNAGSKTGTDNEQERGIVIEEAQNHNVVEVQICTGNKDGDKGNNNTGHNHIDECIAEPVLQNSQSQNNDRSQSDDDNRNKDIVRKDEEVCRPNRDCDGEVAAKPQQQSQSHRNRHGHGSKSKSDLGIQVALGNGQTTQKLSKAKSEQSLTTITSKPNEKLQDCVKYYGSQFRFSKHWLLSGGECDLFVLLPDAVLAKIFSYLPTRDLAALKCTCKDFKWVIEEYNVCGVDSKWCTDHRYQEDPCMQCGKLIDPRGDVSLCRWHPKIFYKNGYIGRFYWTCCFSLHEDAPGCTVSLHDNNWMRRKEKLRRIPRRKQRKAMMKREVDYIHELQSD